MLRVSTWSDAVATMLMDGSLEIALINNTPLYFETVNWWRPSSTARRVYITQQYIVTSEPHFSAWKGNDYIFSSLLCSQCLIMALSGRNMELISKSVLLRNKYSCSSCLYRASTLWVTTLTNSCTHYTKFMDAKITLKIHIKSHIKTTTTCFGTQRNHPQGVSICA